MQRITANGEDFTPRHPLATGQTYSARPGGPGTQHVLGDGEVHAAEAPLTEMSAEDAAWLAGNWECGNEGPLWDESEHDLAEPVQKAPVPSTQPRPTPAQTATREARSTSTAARREPSRTQPLPQHPHDVAPPGQSVYSGYGTAAMPTRPHQVSEGLVMLGDGLIPGRLVGSGDGQVLIRPICGQFTANGVIPLRGTRAQTSQTRQAPRTRATQTRQTRGQTSRSGSRTSYR